LQAHQFCLSDIARCYYPVLKFKETLWEAW
jgi:hypothetical protein